jgi:hypothetical protein
MERNFYNEEFERFLKQKSDQYKMYPSDRVWNNIYSSLHNTRRWVGLGFILLLITSALLVSHEVLLNNYNQVAKNVNQDLVIPSFSNTSVNKDQKDQIQTINLKKLVKVQSLYPVTLISSAGDNIYAGKKAQLSGYANTGNVSSPTAIVPESESFLIKNNSAPLNIELDNLHAASMNAEMAFKLNTAKEIVNVEKEEDQPKLSIQNYNGAIGVSKFAKWSLQLYASPIVSYRRLSNLNNRSEKYVPVAINYAGNIDNYVHHKPALGFELGTKVVYQISNSLHLYAGAQLNYSRYYIDAYNYHSERASIALNNTPVADTVTNYTSIRNFDGYSPEQLQNQYFQVSVPLGAELKLLGNKRLQLSIAGAIQPTFLISSNSYLISSDYKNYIQNPDLARRFNVHTNFEAFVSYKLGGLKWQLGPQFRYQLLSSYSDKYPIREYLTEFGIKLGITKTIR